MTLPQFDYDVVIPTYNRPEELLSSTKTIINQSIPPQNIIIVNDGSQADYTECREILERTLDSSPSKLRWIDLPCNQGVSAARNRGIESSRSGFIAFNDDDDLWESDKAARIASFFATDSGMDVVCHSIATPTGASELRDSIASRSISLRNLIVRNPLPIQATFARQKALAGTKFDERLSHSEDYDFFIQLIKSGANVIKINELLSRRGRDICSTGGLSESRLKMRQGELRAKLKFAAQTRTLPDMVTAALMLAVASLKILLAWRPALTSGRSAERKPS